MLVPILCFLCIQLLLLSGTHGGPASTAQELRLHDPPFAEPLTISTSAESYLVSPSARPLPRRAFSGDLHPSLVFRYLASPLVDEKEDIVTPTNEAPLTRNIDHPSPPRKGTPNYFTAKPRADRLKRANAVHNLYTEDIHPQQMEPLIADRIASKTVQPPLEPISPLATRVSHMPLAKALSVWQADDFVPPTYLGTSPESESSLSSSPEMTKRLPQKMSRSHTHEEKGTHKLYYHTQPRRAASEAHENDLKPAHLKRHALQNVEEAVLEPGQEDAPLYEKDASGPTARRRSTLLRQLRRQASKLKLIADAEAMPPPVATSSREPRQLARRASRAAFNKLNGHWKAASEPLTSPREMLTDEDPLLSPGLISPQGPDFPLKYQALRKCTEDEVRQASAQHGSKFTELLTEE